MADRRVQARRLGAQRCTPSAALGAVQPQQPYRQSVFISVKLGCAEEGWERQRDKQHRQKPKSCILRVGLCAQQPTQHMSTVAGLHRRHDCATGSPCPIIHLVHCGLPA